MPAQPEDRIGVLAEYYGVEPGFLRALVNEPPSNRRLALQRQGINPYLFRTMVDYTRYPDAAQLHKMLRKLHQPIARLNILDFGCMVSDYGLYFARQGAAPVIYDTEEITKFAAFRFQREKFPVQIFHRPCAHRRLMAGRDLVIFGEVLEHLFNPLEPLAACIAESVRYIFTSHYPYGDDDYFKLRGHRASAQALQPACQALLRAHYREIPLYKSARLWARVGTKLPGRNPPIRKSC